MQKFFVFGSRIAPGNPAPVFDIADGIPVVVRPLTEVPFHQEFLGDSRCPGHPGTGTCGGGPYEHRSVIEHYGFDLHGMQSSGQSEEVQVRLFESDFFRPACQAGERCNK